METDEVYTCSNCKKDHHTLMESKFCSCWCSDPPTLKSFTWDWLVITKFGWKIVGKACILLNDEDGGQQIFAEITVHNNHSGSRTSDKFVAFPKNTINEKQNLYVNNLMLLIIAPTLDDIEELVGAGSIGYEK